LRQWPVDIVHCHGIDFAAHLPPSEVPTLVTLHLAAEFYDPEALRPNGRPIWFNCVSEAQRRGFPAGMRMLPVVENGIPVDAFADEEPAAEFALALGRICPEKGFHLAIEAAGLARMPLLLGGEVFPYEAHRRYFAEAVRPHLGAGVHYLGPLDFAAKRRALGAARVLLVPSLVPETSSLVAMEAAAAGTPVVAFPAGALEQIVEPGVTGFLVDGVQAMAEAIPLAARLDRGRIRAVARRRFREERMVAGYRALYRHLAAQRRCASSG
jgi:glycosyltransferase involved in cell wall biosynthesis